MALKVAVHGAGGRMGRTVARLVDEASDVELVAAIEAEGSSLLGLDAGQVALGKPNGVAFSANLSELARADVVIDFSLPVALPKLLAACGEQARPLVLATTGLDAQLLASVDGLARKVPLVAAPNYSTGVAVLYHLAQQASALLPEFDLEIVEMHHRHKVDAPSGTALGLADAAARGRGQKAAEVSVYGRSGHTGARKPHEIGVMTLRGGEVVGDHTLILAGAAERLELVHRAGNRDLFAHGALRAARWVVGRAPGKYGMADVLGLRTL